MGDIDIEEGEILDEENEDDQTAVEPLKPAEAVVPDHSLATASQNNLQTSESATNNAARKPVAKKFEKRENGFLRDKRKVSRDIEHEPVKKLKQSNVESLENEDETIFVLGGSLNDASVQGKTHQNGANGFSKSTDGRYELVSLPEEECDLAAQPERSTDERGWAPRRNDSSDFGKEKFSGRERKSRPFKSTRGETQCMYYLKGGCNKGSECPFAHAYNVPTKFEPCKFYLKDRCNKKEKCQFMHADFPCKFFHTGKVCYSGRQCKFSHRRMDKRHEEILRKFLRRHEEILDNLYADRRNNPGTDVLDSRNAFQNIGSVNSNNNSANLRDSKIPSLFDIEVSIPKEFKETEEGQSTEGGESSRVNGIGNAITPIPSPHSENFGDEADFLERNCLDDTEEYRSSRKHRKEETKKKKHKKHPKRSNSEEKRYLEKEIKKLDKKERKKGKRKKNELQNYSFPKGVVEEQEDSKQYEIVDEKTTLDILSQMPKRQQELYLRIHQQQKSAEDSDKKSSKVEDSDDQNGGDINWYSSDDETSPSSNVASLLDKVKANTKVDTQSETSLNISDLSSIHISDEVTKLLSTIRMQSSMNSETKAADQPKSKWGDLAPEVDESMINIPEEQEEDDDIDVNNLPFKPVLICDTANEIDASITSHPAFEYRLIKIDYETKRDYTSLAQAGKIHENDPRLKLCKGISKPTVPDKKSTPTPSVKPSGPALTSIAGSSSILSTKNAEVSGKTPPQQDIVKPPPRKVLLPDPVYPPIIPSPYTTKEIRDPRLNNKIAPMTCKESYNTGSVGTPNFIPLQLQNIPPNLNIEILQNVPPPAIQPNRPILHKPTDPRLRSKK